jgi:hypothetical protein
MFRRLDHEDESGFVIVSPLRFVAVLFALLPLIDIMLVRRRRRRRLRLAAGLCVACGYDLRATPEKCPECGTVPTAKPPRPGGPVEGRADAARAKSGSSCNGPAARL